MSRRGKYEVTEPEEPVKPKRIGSRIRDAMWDPATRTFCGRNGESWGKIGLFYLIYYMLLAGLFALMLYVLLVTMSPELPRWYHGADSTMQHVPGMTVWPMKPDKRGWINIFYDKNDPSTYNDHLSNLTSVLSAYSPTRTIPVHSCNGTGTPGFCFINPMDFGICDGVSDPDFGFPDGNPCLLLRITKMINWRPEAFTSNPDTALLEDRWKKDHITVSCEGAREKDRDNILKIHYFPKAGFPFSCYPYCGKVLSKYYVKPAVMVKIELLPSAEETEIWCRAWAKNIWTEGIIDDITQRSSVKFRYMRETYGGVRFFLNARKVS